MKAFFILGLAAFLLAGSFVNSHAVLIVSSSSYNTTDPNLDTSSGTSIWDYVGTVNGCGAVYLGNGWAITAAHIGVTAGMTYTLNGQTYTVVSTSTVASGVDLTLIQLSSTPSLSSLSIATNAGFNATVYLVGYGDSDGASGSTTTETWGTNSLAGITSAEVGSYTSTDYYGTSTTYQLVNGDSGGAAFVYDQKTGSYVLLGILEASNSTTSGSTTTYYGYYVSMSTYWSTIQTVTATPEPTSNALMMLGAGLIFLAVRRKRPCSGC